MCGIFGWSLADKTGPKHRNKLDILATVLILENDKRGGHGWGYHAPEKGLTSKGLGDMAQAIRSEDLSRYRLLMGHTRYATTGAKVKDNSHPFNYGKVTLAHNGIVYNHSDLNKNYNRSCAVDSEHFAAHLSEDRELTDIEAYGAIEYATLGQEGIFLGRFNGGELAIASTPLGVVWSSCDESLYLALQLAGLEERASFRKVKSNRLYLAISGQLVNTGLRLGVKDPARFSIADRSITSGKSNSSTTDLWEDERDNYTHPEYCEQCHRYCDCWPTLVEQDSPRFCEHCGKSCIC